MSDQTNQAPGFDITGMAQRLAKQWLDDLSVELEKVHEAGGEPEDALAPMLRDQIISKCLLDPGNLHLTLEDATRNHLQACQLREENLRSLAGQEAERFKGMKETAGKIAHDYFHKLVQSGDAEAAEKLLADCKKVGLLQ
jgi:hypothetical protein